MEKDIRNVAIRKLIHEVNQDINLTGDSDRRIALHNVFIEISASEDPQSVAMAVINREIQMHAQRVREVAGHRINASLENQGVELKQFKANLKEAIYGQELSYEELDRILKHNRRVYDAGDFQTACARAFTGLREQYDGRYDESIVLNIVRDIFNERQSD